jgi:hypothetical protein
MRGALADLVHYARAQGVPWWTSQQIGSWEQHRRAVKLRASTSSGGTVDLEIDDAPDGFTLLLLGLSGDYRAEPPIQLDHTEFLGRRVPRLITGAGGHRIRLIRV